MNTNKSSNNITPLKEFLKTNENVQKIYKTFAFLPKNIARIKEWFEDQISRKN